MTEKDPATSFAAAVCAMFETDAYRSVLDLDDAADFFNSIGFVPPASAVEAEGDDE